MRVASVTFRVGLPMLALALWLGAQAASAGILLQDDFNDNSIDPLKWTTNTTIPAGSASVNEMNGRMELVNRGHLVTAQQYDPLVVGGVRITGRWTFALFDVADFLQILTRSSGTPDGAFGETTEGVEFQSTLTTLSILGRGGVAVANVSTPITIGMGDVFDFEIVDDGFNVSIALNEVGGDGTTAFVSTTSATDAATDFVVFHNREAAVGSGHVAYLDDVVIQTVPEPSSLVLASLGVAGLFVIRRRQNRKARG